MFSDRERPAHGGDRVTVDQSDSCQERECVCATVMSSQEPSSPWEEILFLLFF